MQQENRPQVDESLSPTSQACPYSENILSPQTRPFGTLKDNLAVNSFGSKECQVSANAEALDKRHTGRFDTPIKPNSSATLDLNINFSGSKLVGRQREVNQLQKAFDRAVSFPVNASKVEESSTMKCSNSLILISGSAGQGKSLLAQTLQSHAENANGYFVVGKFDQLKRPEPYAPLVEAMASFSRLVLRKGSDAVTRVRLRLLEAFGDGNDGTLGDVRILIHLIPELSEVIGTLCGSKVTVDGVSFSISIDVHHSVQRLRNAFRKLVWACCSRESPLVLVLDDLQWADSSSLDLMESILVSSPSETEINTKTVEEDGLVLVATCRSDEIMDPLVHPLAVWLRKLEDDLDVLVHNILVTPLTIPDTRDLISTVLQLPGKDPLSEIVAQATYLKTHGNPLFTLEFLKALVEVGVLVRTKAGRRNQWIWVDKLWVEGTACHGLQETSTVVDLFLHRLQRLPLECQLLLATGACLGGNFEEDLLKRILPTFNTSNISMDAHQALSVCIAEGLVREQSYRNSIAGADNRRCIFCHDGIQQAAYAFIAHSDRSHFHLEIGRKIIQNLNTRYVEQHIFLVVDQFVRGIENISGEDEKREIACLCLRAGQTAISAHDIRTALKCLTQADDLLDCRRKWVDDYHLSLTIHNTLAEAHCCLAQFEVMDTLIDSIFLNARTFDDKLRAYMLRVYSLGSLSRLSEAINISLDVLEKLGERFPKRRSLPNLLIRFLMIRQKIMKKSDEDLLNLPDCRDPRKLAAMGFLNLLTTYAYIADQSLFPFLAVRMVSISITFGLSAVSICGFSSYGMLVCGTGDFKGGKRYGKLAIELLKRYENVRSEWLPRAYVHHYGIIALWTQPARSCFPYLAEAQHVGLERDIETAWINSYLLGTHLFSVGEPLAALEPFLRDSIAGMRKDKQDIWAELALLNHEATLLLMGQHTDPVVLNGALQNLTRRSSKLEQVQAVANLNFELYVCEAGVQSMMAHYHLGEFKYALDMANISQNAFALLPAAQLGPYQTFYHGLVAITLLRNNQRPSIRNKNRQLQQPKLSFSSRIKLLHQAKKSLRVFRKLTKNGCKENFQSRTFLLEAELAAWEGNFDVAVATYAMAESAAHQERHLDIQGLACERAAFTTRSFGGDDSTVNEHLGRAIAAYQEWGAWAVAKRCGRLLLPRVE